MATTIATRSPSVLTSVLTDAEESITPTVKEVERTLLFTDVPPGVLKYNKWEEVTTCNDVTDLKQGFMFFCGSLERAFCFTDLQDIDKLNNQNLSMKCLQDDDTQIPGVESIDSDSFSDESANKEDGAVKAAESTDKAADNVAKTGFAATEATGVKKVEPVLQPTDNAFQAANDAKKDGKPKSAVQLYGKPKNAFQASQAEKNKNGSKRRSWSIFRRSSKANATGSQQ